MNLYLLYITRFGLIVFTLLALVLQPWFPDRRMLLHPLPTTSVAIDGHYDPEYGASNIWISEARSEWRCEYRPAYGYGKTCGFSLSWGNTFTAAKEELLTTPICENAASDEDGDGWGWENQASCIVVQGRGDEPAQMEHPECESALSDDDGDGWGWENEQSCWVRAGSTQEQERNKGDNRVVPDCLRSDSDEDGDGWGWENERSCRVVIAEKPDSKYGYEQEYNHCLYEDSDPDGDGWGWENNRSCLMPIEGGRPASIAVADFSSYDYLKMNIHYEGRANALRLSLRNFNPAYATAGDPNSTKFMSVLVRTEDLKSGDTVVKLSEFKVAEWWITQRDAPRQWLGSEYDKVSVLGIDITEFGVHRVRVESIELFGEWLSFENTLLILIGVWALYLLFEGAYRLVYLKREYKANADKAGELLKKTEALNKEKARLLKLSNLDPLTRLLNRQGFFDELEIELDHSGKSGKKFSDENNLGVMVLDLDNFKSINDRFGHDFGDTILKAFSRILEQNLNEQDLVCRWGGEEFVVLVRKTLGYKLQNRAEKIRRIIEAHDFPKLNESLTVSIGVTMFHSLENFESVYRRADKALYKAKTLRNRVVYEV